MHRSCTLLAAALFTLWVSPASARQRERAPPEGPVSSGLFAEAARSVTRRLIEMQVLVPDIALGSYCLLVDEEFDDDVRAAMGAEFPAWAGHLAEDGCEREVVHRRYRLETPIRAGGGRTVVRASGDLLRRWPPGLDGRWWRAWQAYCVILEGAAAACDVQPALTGDPVVDGARRDLFGMPAGDAPIEIAVEVTTKDAYRTDTVRAAVPSVPELRERAVVDDRPRMCAGRMMWNAIADWPGGGEIVLVLRLPSDEWPEGFLTATHVRRLPAGRPPMGMTCPTETSDERLALFTLGGVGQPAASAIRFCLNEPDCAQSYSIDPDRHELALEPHLRFRLADLRPEAVAGADVLFRLHVDRVIEGLLPFVVIHGRPRPEAWLLRRSGDRTFDFSGVFGMDLPPEAELWLYLVTDAGEGG